MDEERLEKMMKRVFAQGFEELVAPRLDELSDGQQRIEGRAEQLEKGQARIEDTTERIEHKQDLEITRADTNERRIEQLERGSKQRVRV